MASRIPDEETGVVPPPSEQEHGMPSRPSTRSGRSSPPPQRELSSPSRPDAAQTSGNAGFSTDALANKELDIESPEKWIWKNFGQYLVTKVKPWPFDSANQGEESFEVNLAEVQRMYLVQLRIRLARHIARWELSGGKELRTCWNRRQPQKNDEMADEEGCWEDDLHSHGALSRLTHLTVSTLDSYRPTYLNHMNLVQGLQDYDYMDKCTQESSRDPFRITGERVVDRIILDTSLGDARSPLFDRMRVRDVSKWDAHARAVIPSRTDNRYKRLFSRLIVAGIGASFLIGPMWLMMLRGELYVALISTTVFVVVFGALAAFFLENHAHVLSSTAAYAAVLVVFVGLTSEASTTK
jgi:hypothetical protein